MGNKKFGTRKTKYNQTVMLSGTNTKNNEFDVYVDILFGDRTTNVLQLLTEFDNDTKEIIIEDIQIAGVDRNKGYGSVALEYLIDKAKKNHIKRIYGSITQNDFEDHGDRLVHFYKKYGFDVNIVPQGGGSINMYL